MNDSAWVRSELVLKVRFQHFGQYAPLMGTGEWVTSTAREWQLTFPVGLLGAYNLENIYAAPAMRGLQNDIWVHANLFPDPAFGQRLVRLKEGRVLTGANASQLPLWNR